jgi:hypothetical protein
MQHAADILVRACNTPEEARDDTRAFILRVATAEGFHKMLREQEFLDEPDFYRAMAKVTAHRAALGQEATELSKKVTKLRAAASNPSADDVPW